MKLDPSRPIIRECPADGKVCSRMCQGLCKIWPEGGATFRVPILKDKFPRPNPNGNSLKPR